MREMLQCEWTWSVRPAGTYGDGGDLSPLFLAATITLFQKGVEEDNAHSKKIAVPTWFENVPLGLDSARQSLLLNLGFVHSNSETPYFPAQSRNFLD